MNARSNIPWEFVITHSTLMKLIPMVVRDLLSPVISNKYQHPLYLRIHDVIMKHALKILNEHDFFEGVLHYDVIAAQV